MSQRAQSFADQFDEVHNAVLEVARSAGDDDWSIPCPGTGWPVGGVFRHIARWYILHMELATAFIMNGPFLEQTASWHGVDRLNTQFAATRPKAETIALLRTNGAAMAAFIRAMSDEQLDRIGKLPAASMEFSCEALVERMLINHASTHLAEIRSALSSARKPAVESVAQ